MNKNIMDYETVALDEDGKGILIIDQTLLPGRTESIRLETAKEIWEAIYLLKVRGAPAIGVTAAFGLSVLARQIAEDGGKEMGFDSFYERLKEQKDYLDSARPTAVNLSWALNRMDRVCRQAHENGKTVSEIVEILGREAKKIKEEDMKLFLSKTGNDMENIYQEWLKLSAYTEGREEITKGDIEEICSVQISGKIFEMIHAISERKQKKALEYYYDLLTLKEPPMRILFLIAREYNLLLQVKQLEKEGKPAAEIAKITKLQGFLVGKYISQAKQFSVKNLKETLAECVETEEAVKTGQLDGQLGVELLIIKFSTKKQESFEEEK